MYFSKIWFSLTALAGAFALALAVLAQVPSVQRVEAEQAERLEYAQQSLQLLFKVNARKWMDTAARAATDREIVGPLDEASRAAEVTRSVHQTAQQKLRVFNGDLKLQLMWAVDRKGRVVARVGAEETAFGDDVSGLPLVDDALRGYRGDDTWAVGGKLYRVVAVPVIARGTGLRYAGALVLGEEVDAKLAFAIKERLRLDVAFILRERVLGSSIASPVLEQIPALVKKQAATVAKAGWSGVVPLDHGDDSFLVAAGPFVGEGGVQQAIWVLLVRRGATAGLKATFAAVTKEDLKPGRFPWFLLGGALVSVIVIGLILMRLEADGPVGRFLAKAKEFGRGEIPKLPDALFGGKFGAIARNINTGMEKMVRAVGPQPASMQGKDLSEILGPPSSDSDLDAVIPHAGAAIPDLVPPSLPIVDELPPQAAGPPPPLPPPRPPTVPSGVSRPSAAPPPAIPDEDAALPFGPPPEASDPPDVFASTPPLPPVPPVEESDHGSTRPYEIGEPPEVVAPDPTGPTTVQQRFSSITGPTAVGPDPEAGAALQPVSTSTTGPTKVQPAPRAPTGPTKVGGAPTAPPREAAGDTSGPKKTAAGGVSGRAAAGGAPSHEGDLDEYFHKIFEEFVEMKKACGEPTDAMTFEKFAVKLRNNRSTLVEKYRCKSVKFQVYIKDGKAALKATPVK